MAGKKTGIKEHNEYVREIADELKRDKSDIRENVDGKKKQAKIGEFVNDVNARENGLRRICEVLTEKDFDGDKQRYIEFKNYCNEYDFGFCVVDKDGNRHKIDPATFGKKSREARKRRTRNSERL